MANTGFENFDKTVQQTNEILSEIEGKYGWEERRNQSYAALAVVLACLRDRLPVNDAANLGAQLTFMLRGIYYEGWDPSKVPVKMDKKAFLQRIREDFQFSIEGDIEDLTETVLSAVLSSVSEGEVDKLKDILPEDISSLINK